MVKTKIVKSIIFDRYQYGNNENGIDINYDSAEVGKNGVKHIIYHEPKGEGDRHFCDIIHEDKIQRVFNLNNIFFELS